MENEIKEKFYSLLDRRGFEGLRAFSRATGVGVGNIYSNIQGKHKLSLDRAFIFANTLGVPIDTILAIFYKDKMIDNIKAVRGQKKN